MQSPTKTAPAPDDVWLLLRSARIMFFALPPERLPDQSKVTEGATLMPPTGRRVATSPGVNVLRAADAKAIGIGHTNPELDPANASDIERISSPCNLEPFLAIETASKSTNAFALKRWLEIETREPVRAAIEARLAPPKSDQHPRDRVMGDEPEGAEQPEGSTYR